MQTDPYKKSSLAIQSRFQDDFIQEEYLNYCRVVGEKA